VATILAAAVKKIGFDLVYAGVKGVDDDQGWVGIALAELLDLPLVNAVRSTTAQGTAVRLVRDVEGGRETVEAPLPVVVTASGGRFIDLAWSTDSRSVAATQRDAGSSTTDVYVAPAGGGAWRNGTLLRNAFLSQWISADELLVHTGNGLIAVQGTGGGGLRPLTGQVATSPFLGDDGRVYYFAGQVSPSVRDSTVPVINAGQSRVWSLTLDGGDIRPETTQAYDDVRLAGRWPDGRFVVHQGASTALAFLAESQPPFDTILGVVDRVVFSPDRRTAIGLTGTRIFRYDTAQPSTPVVLLSDVLQPDAWYPETVTVATSPAPVTARPAARYTFALGGLLWVTDASGAVRLVRQLQGNDVDLRRLSGVAVPQWSPAGDRIVYFDVLPNSDRGAVFVTDATAGTGGRLSDQDAVGPFPTWTPDGNVAYTDLVAAFDSAGFGADGEVRVVSPTNGARVTTYHAREVAFGGGKTYLIDNGKLDLPLQTRTQHAVLEATPTGTRTVATMAELSAGTQFGVTPQLQLSMLGSSADGTILSVRISPAAGSVGFIFATFRASDGRPTLQADGREVADFRWAPNGHLSGMTLGNIPVVRDADTGTIEIGKLADLAVIDRDLFAPDAGPIGDGRVRQVDPADHGPDERRGRSQRQEPARLVEPTDRLDEDRPVHPVLPQQRGQVIRRVPLGEHSERPGHPVVPAGGRIPEMLVGVDDEAHRVGPVVRSSLHPRSEGTRCSRPVSSIPRSSRRSAKPVTAPPCSSPTATSPTRRERTPMHRGCTSTSVLAG